MILVNFVFIVVVSFCLSSVVVAFFASHREESFLAVHRSTERKPVGGYAENAETLSETTDYADVTNGSLRAA